MGICRVILECQASLKHYELWRVTYEQCSEILKSQTGQKIAIPPCHYVYRYQITLALMLCNHCLFELLSSVFF